MFLEQRCDAESVSSSVSQCFSFATDTAVGAPLGGASATAAYLLEAMGVASTVVFADELLGERRKTYNARS
jgi:hypothetical protein